MKKIILILLISLIYTSCKAQTIPLFGSEPYGEIDGAYYKDINDEYNPFIGTWMYSTMNDTLIVSFIKKKFLINDSHTYYSDELVGEFKYIENGIEKANTISNINANHNSVFSYNMYSIAFLKKQAFPVCNDCSSSEKRLSMHFDEPTNDDYMLSANFVMRHVIESGVEKLKVQFVMTAGAGGYTKDLNSNTTSTSNKHSIPYGEYILIKQ